MSTRLEIIKKYLEEEPGDSFLRYAYALELIGENEHAKALELLESLLVDDADYLAAYYQAGKSAEALGDMEKAMNWYEKGQAVARKQNNMQTLSELRIAYESLEE